MKSHKFDVEDAEKHGIKKAVILEHLKYHQESNFGNPDYMIDGKSHAHIKPKTVEKMFPYFSYQSIKRWLKELEEDGVIESQKPGKNSGKHTLLYHVVGHSLPRSELNEGNSQNEKRNRGNSQKSTSEQSQGNSQNEKSNSQNEKSARDIEECARKSQNEKSSIITMCSDHSASARAREVWDDAVQTAIQQEASMELIDSCETLEQLLGIYRAYRRMKNKFDNLFSLDAQRSHFKQLGITKVKAGLKNSVRHGWAKLVVPDEVQTNSFNGSGRAAAKSVEEYKDDF